MQKPSPLSLIALIPLAALCVALGNSSQAGLATPAGLERAIVLHKEGTLPAALKETESVALESPEYPRAFTEQQKILYRQKSWDRFFGNAVFYRKHGIQKFFAPELLLLEITALIRHCKFDSALLLVEGGRALTQHVQGLDPVQVRFFLDRLKIVRDHLDLQITAPGTVRTKSIAAPLSLFSPTLKWNVSASSRDQVLDRAVKNPASLRVYVRDECPRATPAQQEANR